MIETKFKKNLFAQSLKIKDINMSCYTNNLQK